jgi:hypothetical protein
LTCIFDPVDSKVSLSCVFGLAHGKEESLSCVFISAHNRALNMCSIYKGHL